MVPQCLYVVHMDVDLVVVCIVSTAVNCSALSMTNWVHTVPHTLHARNLVPSN